MISAALLVAACGEIRVEGTGGGAGDTTTAAGGTTTAGGAGGTGATAGQGGTGASPCQSDADCQSNPWKPACDTSTGECVECQANEHCAQHPDGPICDLETKQCVACIVSPDPAIDCGIGAYCVVETGKCEAGCTADEDCPTPDGSLICDVASHACVGCLADADCPAGTLCDNGVCAAGCTMDRPCAPGLSCCNGACFDLATDEEHCGACFGSNCFGINSMPFCNNGICQVGPCLAPYQDCNGDPADGCEVNTLVDGLCFCSPGQQQPCYLGMPGTQGVGVCKEGVRTCLPSGLGFGACNGQVLPAPEVCANGLDDDCNGLVDDPTDFDLDGYSVCDGDCDDQNAQVNPGAMEIWFTWVDDDNNPMTPPVAVPGGNGVDDDCDPSTPDTVPPAACASSEELSGVTAMDLAKAFDLCKTAEESPPPSAKTWGLISAEFRTTDGAVPDPAALAAMQDQQSAVLSWFGAKDNAGACDGSGEPVNVPFVGPTMAALSTGRMRRPEHADYVSPEPGTIVGTPSACPADYLAAHGGLLPSIGGCLGSCPSGSGCFDGISLRLRVRVPTNTHAFSFRSQVFSAEYPERLCSPYNDAFLALVGSMASGYPADKNVAYDTWGNPFTMNDAFFRSCDPAACFACAEGNLALSCTGLQGGKGGSTGWQRTDAPAWPGETLTVDLSVFDVSDAQNDTMVLLDGFAFSVPTIVIWDDH